MRLPVLTLTALMCLTACSPDADGDGFRGRDCDDTRIDVSPRAVEQCDGVDNDCDGFIDEGVSIITYWDRDGDGFGDDDFVSRRCTLPADGVLVPGDCNDVDPSVNPDAVERCNDVDDDCDRDIDEDVSATLYADLDDDGFGDPAGDTQSGCPGLAGWSDDATDCNDSDPAVSPGAPERCNAADDDCDGVIDNDVIAEALFYDDDGDGYGDPGSPATDCEAGLVNNSGDCNDADPAISPDASEIANNGKDEDCDDFIDELAIPEHFATLDDALGASSSGDVVQLGPGTWYGTADLVGKNITLAGAGCERTTLYADGVGTAILADAGRVTALSVAGGATVERGGGLLVTGDVTVDHACFESNFSAQDGGAIAVMQGMLTLSDSTLARNDAEGSGGGLYVGPTGTADVRRTMFVDNFADLGAGLRVELGFATVSSSTFTHNRAFRRGGAIAVRRPDDGTTGGSLVGHHLTFHNNEAQIYNAEAVWNLSGSVDLTDVLFTGHTGVGDELVADSGLSATTVLRGVGAWNNAGPETELGDIPTAVRGAPTFLSTSDFRLGPDSVYRDAGVSTSPDADGTPSDIGATGGTSAPAGADAKRLDTDSDGMSDAYELVFHLNPWLDDSALDPDADGLTNGDEALNGTDPRLADTDVDGVSDGDDERPTDPSNHRPLADAGADSLGLVFEPVLLDGLFAYDPNDDALTASWKLTPPAGGSPGIVAPTLLQTTFSPDVPGRWVATLTVSDGASQHSDTVNIDVIDANIIVPDDADTLEDALDLVGPGDTVVLRAGAHAAPAELGTRNLQIVGIDGPALTELVGTSSGSVVEVASGVGFGLRGLTIRGGEALRGGGVNINAGAVVSLTDMHFIGNTATERGGAVYASDASLTLTDTLFSGNHADRHGGGVAVYRTPLTAVRATFLDNSAAEGGGGLYAYGATGEITHRLTNPLFQGNTSPKGAALNHFATADWLEVDGGVFVDNHGDDGVIASQAGVVTLRSSLVAHNHTTTVLYRETGRVVPLQIAVWDNAGALNVDPDDDLPFAWGLITEDPLITGFVDDGVANDLWAPRPGSPLLDAGFPEHVDRDGSRRDIGNAGGSDPAPGAERWARDTDGDGLSDGWEARYGLDPRVDDASEDPDGDGLDNGAEFAAGTDPTATDSDGDGVADGTELAAGDDPSDASDHRPTADAGPDQRGDVGQVVLLDGSASSDPNGDPLAYTWSLVSAPDGSALSEGGISGRLTDTASFTPDVRGRYELTLVVADGGAASPPSTVRVSVSGQIRVPEDAPTIAAALLDPLDGDIIVLGEGVFAGPIATSGVDIDVIGAGADKTVVVAPSAIAVMLVEDGETVTATGLTLTGGAGTGGGVDCRESTVTLVDVDLAGNAGYAGGGMSLQDCSTILSNVNIRDNQSSYNGGGIFAAKGRLTWRGGSLSHNRAGSAGGGAHLTQVETSLDNVVVSNNYAPATAGGIHQTFGTFSARQLTVDSNVGLVSAVYLSGLSGELHNSVASNNAGFGVYVYQAPLMKVDWLGAHNNESGPLYPAGSLAGLATVLEDPRYVGVSDYHLRHDSPLRNAGDPSCKDSDESVCDIGAYAGPYAPRGSFDWYTDADGDGLPDGWAAESGVTGPDADDDGDGLSAAQELAAGTQPNVADSDGDGVSDGDEVTANTDPNKPPTSAPTADASDDQVAAPSDLVQLDGSNSAGTNLTYHWTLAQKPGGSAVSASTLSDANAQAPTFTPDKSGRYVWQLIVRSGGQWSAPAFTTVDVTGTLLVPESYATLQQALEVVLDGGDVHLAAGTFPTRASLADKDVTIRGEGAESTLLNGQGLGTVLTLEDASVVLEDLALVNGVGGQGGAVFGNRADLTLRSVFLSDNRAINGGAVTLIEGNLDVDGARFTDNLANRLGGAAYVRQGDAVVAHALFANNSAADRSGGALYLSQTDLMASNSIFHDNHAGSGGAVMANGTSQEVRTLDFSHITATWGSAAEGAFLHYVYGDVTVTDSIIAFHRDGVALDWQRSTDSTFEMSRSVLWDNQPDHTDAIPSPLGDSTMVEADPRLWSVTNNGDWTDDDWALKPSSSAKNIALGLDIDGSPADAGAFGGLGGDWTP